MRTLLVALLYNLFAFPFMFLFYHVFAIFNSKYRKGIAGRYQSIGNVSKFLKKTNTHLGFTYLIHCSSMGEFEHIKPVIRELKCKKPDIRIIVMFFSPSGYDNVKTSPGVDLFIYSPFDWWLPVLRLFKRINPSALIVAKYDAWPNQIWIARFLGVPRFLVNATLYSSSGRLSPTIRWFQRTVYSQFDNILTISEEDKQNFQKFTPQTPIAAVGDTKYDQVIFRSNESKKQTVFPEEVTAGKMVFVAGSTWPEDEIHLIPVLKKLHSVYKNLLCIICPHEPTPGHIAQLSQSLDPLSYCKYSRLSNYNGQALILIDKIGLLANVYSVSHVAYVGGSFKQNVHNVLEPAVYGAPVIFGPHNQNSHEAQLLKVTKGGLEVHSADDIYGVLNQFFGDAAYRKSVGDSARQLVMKKKGATKNIVKYILGDRKVTQ